METGTRLGAYEIVERLGAGGMGEVWLAQDTRLGRKVAIKVLPPEFAGDADRLSRFAREARTLAALNHPHIAQVYGLEEGDSTVIVMELVEGEDLAQLLERGPLPLEEALPIAAQIAEALEAAHEAGIVHRDLKPANVRVRPDGTAKVLDFGLAKGSESSGGSDTQIANSPTVASPVLSGTGMIMGTAAYMSPEQARGKPVDRRTDVWAFGCVLFEMLAGQRPFGGDDVSMTLASVLKKDLDWTMLPATTPAPVRRMLERCFETEPRRRYQSIGDARYEIETWIAEGFDEGAAAAGTAGTGDSALPATSRPRLPALLAGALAMMALGAVAAWMLKPTPAPPAGVPARFSIDLSDVPGDDFSASLYQVLAISPDGRNIAFSKDRKLWLRRLGELEPVAIRGSEDANTPAFSPDSRQIAFFGSGKLMRVDLVGGAPFELATLYNTGRGLHWAEDGFLYTAADFGENVSRISAAGGPMEMVFDFEAEGFDVFGPQPLPGGDWVLLTSVEGQSWDQARIVAKSRATGELRDLGLRGRDARYVAAGYLLYVDGSVLLAVRFDPATLTVIGDPVSFPDPVRTADGGYTGAAFYAAANDGTLVYAPRMSAARYNLVWVDRAGTVEPMPMEAARYQRDAALSPDGRRLAVGMEGGEGGTEIWVFDVDRSGGQRLASMHAVWPVWSPDGAWIYFTAESGGNMDIWRRRADLGGPAERLLDARGYQAAGSISADGEWLYYTNSAKGPPDIMRLNLIEPADPEPVVAAPTVDYDARLSPDGRFVAFTSSEAGAYRLIVQDIDGGGRWLIDTGGDGWGGTYWWSSTAREILYSRDAGLWRVRYTADPGFEPGPPELLRPHPDRTPVNNLTLSPDGERAVMRQGISTETPATRIEVVLNWFEELAQLVSTER